MFLLKFGKHIFSYLLLSFVIIVFLSSNSSALSISVIPESPVIYQGNATSINIYVSNLIDDINLAEFNFDISFDNSILSFDSYTLGTNLSDPMDGPDDWSMGYDGYGTINISELSWLWDFSAQPESFVLATLTFTGNSAGISNLQLSNIILGDEMGESLLGITEVFDGALEVTTADPVPEPATLFLLITGLVGLSGIRKKR